MSSIDIEPVILIAHIYGLPTRQGQTSQVLKSGDWITRGSDAVIDKRALMFLFIVLMAAFGAIALIILISGS